MCSLLTQKQGALRNVLRSELTAFIAILMSLVRPIESAL